MGMNKIKEMRQVGKGMEGLNRLIADMIGQINYLSEIAEKQNILLEKIVKNTEK